MPLFFRIMENFLFNMKMKGLHLIKNMKSCDHKNIIVEYSLQKFCVERSSSLTANTEELFCIEGWKLDYAEQNVFF